MKARIKWRLNVYWFSIILFLSIASTSAMSQPSTEKLVTIVMMEAEKLKQASMQGNVRVLVDAMPTRVLKKLGANRRALIERIKKIADLIKNKQYRYEKYTISRPKRVYRFNGTLMAILPTESIVTHKIKNKKSRIYSKGYLLALKYSGDHKWYFLNGRGFKNKRLFATLIDNVPTNIELPKVIVTHIKQK